MNSQNEKVDTTSILYMACYSVLVAVFAGSFWSACLIFMFSGLNIFGLYYGAKYGRLLTLFCLYFSAKLLQQRQVGLILLLLCALVSVTGLGMLEQWQPIKRRNQGHSIAPEILLGILFGNSRLHIPDRKWLSLVFHGVLQHISAIKISTFDIGGVLPIVSTRTSRILSVKEVREGILANNTANEQNDGEQGKTAPVGPTCGFTSVIDFSYAADENTKIEVEIPLIGQQPFPVTIARPEMSGSVQLDVRRDVVIGEDGQTSTKVLAIGVRFEALKKIHMHDISIYKAPLQVFQRVPFVQRYVKQNVNSVLLPDSTRVFLFDDSFSSLGTFLLKKDEVWNIGGLLDRLRQSPEQGQTVPAST